MGRVMIRCFVGIGLLLPSSWVLASVFEAVSDQQLVCESSDIVHGQVTDVQAAWDSGRTAIWTTATVQVQDVTRGDRRPNTDLQVREVGGTVDGYTIRAEGFPTFRKGEEVVLLLRPWEDGSGTYRVWGYGRGMFVVDRRDSHEPAAARHDVVESGRATMFTDRIPPTLLLDGLTRQLNAFVRTCGKGEGR
ncbi:MAG: hypothetical protein HYZ91_06570 [Candidatus Omnitrophica bacterium]|nr:hypothetical protein [Candidatus Omnitrophota bacterium]